MEEIKIIIEGLTKKEQTDLSNLVSENCRIEDTNGSDGVVTKIITIFAENPFLCGIAANIFTEIIKSLASESWNYIKVSVKMPDGKNFINLGKKKFIQIKDKYFTKGNE